MAELTLEKQEADRKTEDEKRRIEGYLKLRYSFRAIDIYFWHDTQIEKREAIYIEQKYPSRGEVRKAAVIGFWENIFAYFSKEKKDALDKRKAKTEKKLHENIDRTNKSKRERCDSRNKRTRERMDALLGELKAYEPQAIMQYFSFVLNRDNFSLDHEVFVPDFSLSYESQERQLILDYRLPSMNEVPRTKEWKVDKNNKVFSKEMTKTDYLELYERILFDIAMRTIGMLFESDSENVLNSIVFNGSCVYHHWQSKPTVLLSFIFPKSQFSIYRIEKMDYISKAEIAKLHDVRYIGDINSQKPPAELWETPPTKLIVPFKSSL